MKVGIVGCGSMGSGIAQVAATAKETVVVYDTNANALEKAESSLRKIFNRLIEKGKYTEQEANDIIGRIEYTNTLEKLSGADIVIEAIIESLEIKQSVFKQLEGLVSKDAILASNTSSLSIASIAASCEFSSRVVGIHFFNPAPLMKLVEIIPAVSTSSAILTKAKEIIDSWGKTTVLVKDTPGFIVNRVARPFYGEALRIYEEGIANFATIDAAMKQVGGFRMGPFELMDYIGNDINYTVTETVFKAFYYDPRYKPSFTQKRMSEAGYLGRKSGKGYYDYSDNANSQGEISEEVLEEIFNRILAMLINEAADALFWNIASKEDIDLAMRFGTNYPKGLLAWADEIGIETILNRLNSLYETYCEDRYRPSPLLRKMAKEGSTFFS